MSLETKTGFSFDETRVDLSTGSWGRHTVNIQHGGNNGRLGYYVNLSYTEEDGWRDSLSQSCTMCMELSLLMSLFRRCLLLAWK